MIELGAPPHLCHLVANGVDLEAFRPADNKTKGRPSPRLIAVGNLKPEKGLFLLLEAVRLLKPVNRDIDLLIIGQGPEQAKLEAKCVELGIRDRVRFSGAIPHESLPKYYQKAGILCLTSFREGCPNVIMEALASGIPVAATSVGGVPDMVKNGVNGFMTDKHSPEIIAHTVTQVLEHVWDPAEIRSTVEGLSWQKVGDEIQAVFQNVVTRYKADCSKPEI
jgi:glycosyltransferase involved in cell wall biosynthesis